MPMDRFTEGTDVHASASRACQQLRRTERRCLRSIFDSGAMQTALLANVFSQQLMRSRIEDTDVEPIPLRFHSLPDPSRRNTVVGGFYFNATVQMHRPVAILVITEWFNR